MGLSCTADSSTVRWRSLPHGFDSEGLAAGAMRSMRSCPARPLHHALALGTAPCSFYGVVIGQGGHILRAIRTATNTAIEIQTVMLAIRVHGTANSAYARSEPSALLQLTDHRRRKVPTSLSSASAPLESLVNRAGFAHLWMSLATVFFPHRH